MPRNGLSPTKASSKSSDGAEPPEYVPDFVAETEDYVLMVET
jgi:hypothetical protein